MKYFVISDIHGEYDIMMDALNNAGFDATDKNHCLIVLGDMFDRGWQNHLVYDFLRILPRKILLMGNHDEFFFEFLNGVYSYTDFHAQRNGMDRTIINFAGLRPYITDVREKGYEVHNAVIQNRHPELLDFMRSLKYAVKIGNRILTHAGFKYIEHIGFAVDIHANTPKWIEHMVRVGYGIDGSVKYYFGHWYATMLYGYFQLVPAEGTMPFIFEDFIGIDMATNATKRMHVEVFESDDEVVLYSAPQLLNNMLLD